MIWSAAVIVIAAVAVAAWLGVRNVATVVAPSTEASAGALLALQAPTDKLRANGGSARVRTAVRTAAKNRNAVAAGREVSIETEAPIATIEPVSRDATVTETAAAPIETVSDPIDAAFVAAPPQDDYVYSSEGIGVVAPQLVSLGFAHRRVKGFEARTSRLELLISKSGTVERAKIFSASRNWEDAMLLSRAKTFQFVPAQRNGFPVRYRFVMDVDSTP